jgi:transcriptional regulator with XRE-family HTH domain
MSNRKDEFEKAKVHISLTSGEVIVMLRELQGLSQKELAELTDIGQSNLSAIENDTRQIGKE